MIISPVIFGKIRNTNFINKNNYQNYSAVNDTFVRTTSFGRRNSVYDDKSYTEFVKWAEATDFLSNAGEVADKTGKVLGSGYEGTTYSIPGTDRWVIKEYRRSNYIQQSLKKPKIEKINDISPDLNIGQFVAMVKLPINNFMSRQFYILKKQDGVSYGVPYKYRDDVNDITVKQHLQSLRKAAELPQSTYNKIIGDTDYITRIGYQIDCENPYNFMIDEETNSFNFVDIADKLYKKESQYAEVLYGLLDSGFAENFANSDRSDKEKLEAEELSSAICSKFITAMMKKKVQFSSGRYFEKILNSGVLNKVLGGTDSSDTTDKLRTLGLYS